MSTETHPVEPLSIFVHESIAVMDVVMVMFRVTWSGVSKGLSFEAFKVSLGATAQELSDEEIEQLRLAFDRIADIAFDRFFFKRNTT